MPRASRKEKHEGFYGLERTVQCTLSRILHSNRTYLFNNISARVSQLRALVSVACKLHVFSVCERDGNIWFPVDHTYFNNLFSAVQNQKSKFKARSDRPDVYNADILTSVQCVLESIQPELMACGLGKTQLNKFTGDAAKRMATDVETHIQMRFGQALNIWLKNQFRTLMTVEEYENQRKSMSSYFLDFKNSPQNFPFFERYTRYKRQLDAMDAEDFTMAAEQAHRKPTDVNAYLFSMWEMRKECEVAGEASLRSMKEISVIPQASFKVNFMQVDTSALAFLRALLSKEKTTKAAEYSAVENQEATWEYFFNMKKLRKLRNQSKHPFSWSISTDGVTASVRFLTFIAKASTKKRKNMDTSELTESIRTGFHSEKTILEEHSGHADNVQFYSVDPGVRSVMTIYGIREDKCVYELKQKTYRHSMGFNDIVGRKRFVSQQIQRIGMPEFRKQQRSHQKASVRKREIRRKPIFGQKSVLPENLKSYMQQIKSQWNVLWPKSANGQLQKGTRRKRFKKNAKRRQFTDNVVKDLRQKITVPGKTSVLLFGRGGESGGFKCRGGGVKGPVLGLKRRLAQEFPVICCSEFRTSKLCLHCAQDLAHPWRYNAKSGCRSSVNGVSFCRNTDHKHRTLNRDVDAASKIGYRFLMQLFGRDIGPWNYGERPNVESWSGMRDFMDFYLSQLHPRVEGFGLVTRAMESSHEVSIPEGCPLKKGCHSEN